MLTSSVFRSSILAAPLVLALAISSCADAPTTSTSSDVRQFDPATSTFVDDAPVSSLALVRVARMSMQRDPARKSAAYAIAVPSGKRFVAQVTRHIQREGEEQFISLTDEDSGATVSWAANDTSATQTAADGSQLQILGTDVDTQLVIAANGASLMIDYADAAPGSDREAQNDATVALAMLGSARLSQDQISALGSALSAGDADLGAFLPSSPVITRTTGAMRLFSRFFCGRGVGIACAAVGFGGAATGNAILGMVAAGCDLLRNIFCH